LAGAYRLIDPGLHLPAGLHPVGLQQGTDGPVEYVIPLVLQDRMFDTNGQFYFPAGVPFTPSPQHPCWVPEFVGDTIVVDGEV
jgi:spore coat protein A